MTTSRLPLKPKDRAIAIVSTLAGVAVPGLHKFYLGQWGWGWLYLLPGLLFWHSSVGYLPRCACLFEFTWLLLQGQAEFDQRFNGGNVALANPAQVSQVQTAQVENLAQSLRQLESLRQEGLVSEYEFEQQRRQLLK
jgi:TM2 domain-containing membrane protein YozV